MIQRKTGTIDALLILLEQCFERKAWHGPHLKASIRGVDAEQAGWRPQPRRHNIAEQVLHTAYWKYVVRRRLRRAKRGSFPLKGTNWFPVRGRLSESTWGEYVQLLDDQHAQLRETVAAFGGPGAVTLNEEALRQITGIAAHDVYHAGQIRLLRSLYESP
jgi:hypothetical protein